MAEDDDPQERDESSTLRSVGERLGGWARRVGELVADVSGRPMVPDALREPLAAARVRRIEGDYDGAIAMLRELAASHPEQPHLRFGLGLGLVYALLFGEQRLEAMADVEGAVGDTFGEGPLRVLRAARLLGGGRPDAALDELRRATGQLGRLPDDDELETAFLLHALAGLAQVRLGFEERALRELHKARARLPPEAGRDLRALVLRHGIELSLSTDRLVDAEQWVRESLRADSEDPVARELLCRVLAAKGDRVGAHALLEDFGDDPSFDATRVFVGLTVGLADDAGVGLRALALRHLQSSPEDPQRGRMWALAELMPLNAEAELVDLQRTGSADLHSPQATKLRDQVLASLVDYCAAAPRGTKDRALQELAHVALRLDVFDDTVASPILDRIRADEGTAAEELRLFRARHGLRDGEPAGDATPRDFVPGSPPRFRADPAVGGPWGPDPVSPVRNPDLRGAILASQRLLAAAELCLHRRQPEIAQDLLVGALVEWPGLRRARALLAEIAHPATSARLEELLTGATTLLAAVPNRILGVSLEGVADALSKVIAARERLVRPLTIAIMGEFSAGKSTFVNALLGEAVAPMGVLPTTSTINVFRPGPTGGARVHYRDGRISTLEPGEVQKFLHGLDPTEASRIRHVEIERTARRAAQLRSSARGGLIGDAAVVDTPGLNALDTFHEQVAREFLDEADAVVWVFSATRSGAATEVGMLSELRASGRRVLGVLNKVDTLDEAERTELGNYLREQLGEVLVEVVPLCGREALEFRTSADAQGDDPFSQVEKALESHFLEKARELKRELTARRLDEALGAARTSTRDAIEALETQANAAAARAHRSKTGAQALLLEFTDDLHAGVLDTDDVLLREGLGLGVLQTRRGMIKGPLDPLDAEYLASVLRDATLAALQRALAKVAHTDPAASEVLDRTFVPWARGHIEGLVAAGFVDEALAAHGKKIAEGEAAMRAGFREALEPVADTWVEYARSLVRDVEQARIRAERSATSAPRAEALRLRMAVLASIDALREALGDIGT